MISTARLAAALALASAESAAAAGAEDRRVEAGLRASLVTVDPEGRR